MMMFGEARRKPKTWRCHHSASETGVSPNRRSGRFVQIQMQRSWYRFHRQSGSHLKVLIVIAVRRHAIYPNSCLWNISVWQQHALTLLPSRKIWPHLACPHRRVFSETVQTATANVAAMLDGFKSVGTRATMSEIIGDRINIYMARGVGFTNSGPDDTHVPAGPSAAETGQVVCAMRALEGYRKLLFCKRRARAKNKQKLGQFDS
ncbi:hypothetical protein VOI32_21625 [Paraburkholderia caribensis]|uniref:Uncharacterized protein n=1 Tax=Paraburkholderia caribensis TaxID=75105 RepID=A0ABV0E3E8_9BURK|nr:hypothetical protein [Paraburkholderia caribensis]MCO4876761.1 hypothetical protein [Paraburkholderia caribensis]